MKLGARDGLVEPLRVVRRHQGIFGPVPLPAVALLTIGGTFIFRIGLWGSGSIVAET